METSFYELNNQTPIMQIGKVPNPVTVERRERATNMNREYTLRALESLIRIFDAHLKGEYYLSKTAIANNISMVTDLLLTIANKSYDVYDKLPNSTKEKLCKHETDKMKDIVNDQHGRGCLEEYRELLADVYAKTIDNFTEHYNELRTILKLK